MSKEMVVLVDTQDQVIGVAEKMQAHEQGLLHRAFSVFVVREQHGQLEILLQQRQSEKYHCGGLWTNTCCSHPRIDEDIVTAASRRLQEEMGLNVDLTVIDSFIYRAEFSNGLVEYEYDYVLIGYYNNAAINPNPFEVENYSWCTINQLKRNLNDRPELYTPWLKPALQILETSLEHTV